MVQWKYNAVLALLNRNTVWVWDVCVCVCLEASGGTCLGSITSEAIKVLGKGS